MPWAGVGGWVVVGKPLDSMQGRHRHTREGEGQVEALFCPALCPDHQGPVWLWFWWHSDVIPGNPLSSLLTQFPLADVGPGGPSKNEFWVFHNFLGT